MRRILLLSKGGLVAIAVSALGLACRTEPTQQFTIPTEPDVAVVEVQFSGGLAIGVRTIAIYGDDRIERHEASGTRHQVLSSVQLTRDQVREIVGNAKAAGLVELTHDQLRQKIESHPAFDPDLHVEDAGSVTVRFRLDAQGFWGKAVDSSFN